MHLQALYPDLRFVLVPVIISHNESVFHYREQHLDWSAFRFAVSPVEILFPSTTKGQSQK